MLNQQQHWLHHWWLLPGHIVRFCGDGRIDGMVYVLGMIVGLVGFAEFHPHLRSFANSTPMGQITLPRLFNLPYGLLVFAVVLLAIGAFMFAEWAEKKFGGKEPDPEGSLIAKTRQLTPVRVLALGQLAAGLVASVSGDPYRGSHTTIDTRDLGHSRRQRVGLSPSRRYCRSAGRRKKAAEPAPNPQRIRSRI